jgi:hypothetical protein
LYCLKKILSISLAFVFLLSTLGITIGIAYCPMKKNYTFSLKTAKSCCCKKADKGNCCTSKTIVLKKIENDYVSTSFINDAPQFEIITIAPIAFLPKLKASYGIEINFYKDTGPPEPPVSRSILYRSILI